MVQRYRLRIVAESLWLTTKHGWVRYGGYKGKKDDVERVHADRLLGVCWERGWSGPAGGVASRRHSVYMRVYVCVHDVYM